MTSPLEAFDAEMKERSRKEQESLTARYAKTVTRLEEEGVDVFTPFFDIIEMRHRQHLIFLLKQRGWKMTHWSVITHQNVACGYPVFEKELL